MEIESKLYAAGHCTHMAAITLKGNPWRVRQFPAICALLKHPTVGNILFDTGYSERFFTETRRWPFSLYGRLTPVVLGSGETLAAQLEKDGIAPGDVGAVILSHFHADHLAGLRDFPSARIICSRMAYEHVRSCRGWSALRKGFLPGLMPDDFEQRTSYVEDRKEIALPYSMKPFDRSYDLFGDGSVTAIMLPGHARGQFGIHFSDPRRGPTLLAADACWSSRAYRENLKPAAPAYLALDNGTQYDNTLGLLHELHAGNPDLRIVPSHCHEVHAEIRELSDA